MEAATGSRLLGEMEEMSLEEALDTLRTSVHGSKSPLKKTYIPELDEIATRHFRETQAPTLGISGRHLPLLYKLASSLASAPHNFALIIIDMEGRFDATRLSCSAIDARHIYIQVVPPPPLSPHADENENNDQNIDVGDDVRFLVESATKKLLYEEVAIPSAQRQLWGTIVIGGFEARGDVVSDKGGWLRVSREHIEPLAAGLTMQEVLDQRDERQRAVEDAPWVAESRWGRFTFRA